MKPMPVSDANYGRDLDLNLLRVFVVVAETGSVTKAAARLYITQPGVSSALRRLALAINTTLFVREGRGLALTGDGERLLANVRPHLHGLVEASLSPAQFNLATSDRVIRAGLSDMTEGLIVRPLLAAFAREAPCMRLIISSVQFRTVTEALMTRQLDMALTVADELPPSIHRAEALPTSMVCLFDPAHARVGRVLREADYFAHDHVIVSYNQDLRGVVEDVVGKQRNVRCALSSFSQLGDVVDGSALLATVPKIVASQVCRVRPHLRTRELPFNLASPTSSGPELLWPAATDDDPACRFVREKILSNARKTGARRVAS